MTRRLSEMGGLLGYLSQDLMLGSLFGLRTWTRFLRAIEPLSITY